MSIMEYLDVFHLYDELVPYKYEAKNISHGENDYRVAIFTEWPTSYMNMDPVFAVIMNRT